MKMRVVTAVTIGLALALYTVPTRPLQAQAGVCAATNLTGGVASTSYNQPHTLLTILWAITYDCPGGQSPGCGVCAQTYLTSSSSPNGNFTPVAGSGASALSGMNHCGTTYQTPFSVTYSPLAANTYYKVGLYGAPVDPNTGGCPANFSPANYSYFGSEPVNGPISNPPVGP